MGNQWSKERAWEWYRSRPWMRGCNYMSADCANRIDQWQSLGFEERFSTTEEELKLMQETGFNTIRIIIEYLVWKEEHDSFLERFDRYLALCAKYGISCMVVLGNDCMPPKEDPRRIQHLGVQEYDIGYHGGKKFSQHGVKNDAEPNPHPYLDDPAERVHYFEMVEEIVARYKNDERVCIWDVYNEPGNRRRGKLTVPILKELFARIRKIDPMQPLTCGAWRVPGDEGIPLAEEEQLGVDLSDIITFHCYGKFTDMVRQIKRLKKLGRPLINTEWLARCMHNTVFDNFPLFYLEEIGCYNWGFVAGKYQTYEPWEAIWHELEKNPECGYDVTQWFHDLYRPNHRPYDPKEIKLIKKICGYADKDFERKQ